MYVRHSLKFGKEITIIHPGEYYVSEDDEFIGTLLGSCVAVCLFDEEKSIAGMNHFMLPGKISGNDIFSDRSARYGITAINKLIESMKQNGASGKDLAAKIFGGGHVMSAGGESVTIPDENVKLARVMMEIEDIPIKDQDVGGNFTRKLLMDVKTGKVYLKKTDKTEILKTVNERDRQFAKRSFKK